MYEQGLNSDTIKKILNVEDSFDFEVDNKWFENFIKDLFYLG